MFKALLVACAIAISLDGQGFEVASIHAHSPDDSRFRVRLPTGGQFQAAGAPAKLLLMLAYRVQESQIVGGPGWFTSEKWDIDARSDRNDYSVQETTLMLRNLLEERFSLKTHRETQERPVYVLTVARGGPRFKPSDKNTTNIRPAANSFRIERGKIADVTELLATSLGRPVVDRTGLSGLYDLSVQWDDAPIRQGGLPGTAPPDQDSPASDHGSIFTAVRDQLGLRLDPQRAPIEVIIVDAIERPSPN